MSNVKIIIVTILATIVSVNMVSFAGEGSVKLPNVSTKGEMSVEQAIFERRSVRKYTSAALSLEEVAQILWSAGGLTIDGMTGPTRAFPSAGGIYPLEVYLVAGNVAGLEPGIYHYDHVTHSLDLLRKGDHRKDLSAAAYGQVMLGAAPVALVITMEYDKVRRKYGDEAAAKFIPMDAGHLGGNVHLQAQAIGLGAVMIGGFRSEGVRKVLGSISSQEEPVYMMAVGEPAAE